MNLQPKYTLVKEDGGWFTRKVKLNLPANFIQPAIVPLIILGSLTFSALAYAVTENISGKATVVNTGNFLDFDNYASNVSVDDLTGDFSGYAWLEDLGWVAFGTQDNDQGPVHTNLDTGAVTGKAKVLNTSAYLDFTNFGSNASIVLSTGTFTGYVWSEDLGWIDFTNSTVLAADPFYKDIPEGDSGTDLNLKILAISGVDIKDVESEIDPDTKNSDKEIKVIQTNRNRPTISFGLVDEDDKDVEIKKYDIQIQYTDALGRRQDSYKTWVKGIEHNTPEHSESVIEDGFKIIYSGEPKNKVKIQPITKQLKVGTYYIRIKVYDKAGNSAFSKEVKLIVDESTSSNSNSNTGSLSLSEVGAIAYDGKYSSYYYNSNLLTLKGSAPANSQVELFVDNVRATQVTANGSGNFTINHNYLTVRIM